MTELCEDINHTKLPEIIENNSERELSDEVLEKQYHLVRMKPSSLDRIAHLLQEAGYKAKITGNEGFKFILSASDGWNFKITLHDDAPAGSDVRHLSFQFSSGWSIQVDELAKISEAANAFNRQYRYAKAFVGGDEGYVYTEVEMSHFGFDGVSDDAFISYLELFFYLRRTYVDLCKAVRSERPSETS